MKYKVTVSTEDGEVLAMSKKPVEMKYLPAEGRDIGREAWERIIDGEIRARTTPAAAAEKNPS